MCPEDQILSLYYDRELPSPWKEKMENHLASCEKCRSHLAKFNRLSKTLETDKLEIPAELKNRVWSKIEIEKSYNSSGKKEFPLKKAWNRRVSLPIPIAAAAAAAFIVISMLALQNLRYPTGNQKLELGGAIAADVKGIIPVSDMNSVLQYLSGEDMADFVIIRLPETRSFSSSGEPALIKAADYSRRNSSR